MSGHASQFDLVVSSARLFDGQAMAARPHWVGVRGGRIAAVSDTPLPGLRTVEGQGCTLMPGLIDAHVHLFDFRQARHEEAMQAFVQERLPAELQAFLDCGVTSVKSVGDPELEGLALRASIEAGAVRSPRLFAVGTAFTAPGGHPSITIYRNNPWYAQRATAQVDDEAEARRVVQRLAAEKVDAVKVLYQGGCDCAGASSKAYIWRARTMNLEVAIKRLRRRVLKAVVEEAHAHGLKVTAHTIEQEAALQALEDGVDGLEHGVVDEPITDPRVAELLLKNDATYVPTLVVHGNEVSNANLALLAKVGVRIALGTDSFMGFGQFGQNTLAEAGRMAAAGMAPLHVLRAATKDAADHLGRADLGRLSTGAMADFILVDGDPGADIGCLGRLGLVVKGGEIVAGRMQADGQAGS